jgi:hypothetical protein
MTRTALIRGAAVSGVIVGVLAVGTAPAFAWYTTGPGGETICEFGGTYPDCNTEPTPTPSTSEGGGGATSTPTPSETPTPSATPSETPSPGTSEGGGGATGVPSPTALPGGTGTTTTSGAAVAELPFTGFEVGAAVAIGLAALGAGTVFIVGSRRRRGTTSA